ESLLVVSNGFIPMSLSPSKPGECSWDLTAPWQHLADESISSFGKFIITQHEKLVIRYRQQSFGRVWLELLRHVQGALRCVPTGAGGIVGRRIHLGVRTRKPAPGERESGVESDRLLVKAGRLFHGIDRAHTLSFRRQAAQIHIVSFGITCWLDRQCFFL